MTRRIIPRDLAARELAVSTKVLARTSLWAWCKPPMRARWKAMSRRRSAGSGRS